MRELSSALDLLLRIIKPPHDDFALRGLADMFRTRFDSIRKQRQTRSAFHRINCTSHEQDQSASLYSLSRSRYAPGTTKLSNGAWSGISAFGRTKAPVEISGIFGVAGDEGRDVRTTLAKWVGTPMFGGLPIIS